MLFFNHTPPLTHPARIPWNFSKFFGFLGGKNEKILRMVRNAQEMISRMFFIVGYFPHLGGGKRGVENFHTIYFFFFEGFPNKGNNVLILECSTSSPYPANRHGRWPLLESELVQKLAEQIRATVTILWSHCWASFWYRHWGLQWSK